MSNHPRLPRPPTGPHAAEDIGEAKNPAWWSVMVLGLVAAAVGGAAVLLLNVVLGVIAAVLVVATMAVGVILSKMGMGNYSYEEGDSPGNKETLGIK